MKKTEEEKKLDNAILQMEKLTATLDTMWEKVGDAVERVWSSLHALEWQIRKKKSDKD